MLLRWKRCAFLGAVFSWQKAHAVCVLILACPQVLEPLLPAGRQPPDSDAAAAKAWLEGLQHALVAALDECQATFACTGFTAGTTVTILIQARRDAKFAAMLSKQGKARPTC